MGAICAIVGRQVDERAIASYHKAMPWAGSHATVGEAVYHPIVAAT
jgi:hypothetical protein